MVVVVRRSPECVYTWLNFPPSGELSLRCLRRKSPPRHFLLNISQLTTFSRFRIIHYVGGFRNFDNLWGCLMVQILRPRRCACRERSYQRRIYRGKGSQPGPDSKRSFPSFQEGEIYPEMEESEGSQLDLCGMSICLWCLPTAATDFSRPSTNRYFTLAGSTSCSITSRPFSSISTRTN